MGSRRRRRRHLRRRRRSDGGSRNQSVTRGLFGKTFQNCKLRGHRQLNLFLC